MTGQARPPLWQLVYSASQETWLRPTRPRVTPESDTAPLYPARLPGSVSLLAQQGSAAVYYYQVGQTEPPKYE